MTKGTTINLIADGPDEEEAVSALVELITSNFTD
ncbi:HPr family phosphocarrier protein [Agathobaculum sp.]